MNIFYGVFNNIIQVQLEIAVHIDGPNHRCHSRFNRRHKCSIGVYTSTSIRNRDVIRICIRCPPKKSTCTSLTKDDFWISLFCLLNHCSRHLNENAWVSFWNFVIPDLRFFWIFLWLRKILPCRVRGTCLCCRNCSLHTFFQNTLFQSICESRTKALTNNTTNGGTTFLGFGCPTNFS